MKSIAGFVADGINSRAELEAALRTAMQLEFSTLPPYLCAEWAVDINNDPSRVGRLLANIAEQEMYHFALVGNILSAIGGQFAVAQPGFIVDYPTDVLPGGIKLVNPVDLRPLSMPQVQVFMDIEHPAFTPVGLVALATIGEFYDTLIKAIQDVAPAFDPNAHQIVRGDAVKIASQANAIQALETIKRQGEGSPGHPEQVEAPPNATAAEFAHYYRFKSIERGHELEFKDGQWGWTGAPVVLPGVLPFQRSTATPSPSLAFNQIFTRLLRELEACWTKGAPFGTGTMFDLADEGTSLIAQKVCPEFRWQP